MRLHRLQVTAFGPFSGTEEIDFNALSDAGLFLINGPTGAGKTSVLDAVCFALYGQVPGSRNAAKLSLRSDHAAPEVGPEVVLETSIRGRTFRVTRSPAWSRPKLRGTGFRQEQSHVLVEELENGVWVGLTNRLDEAGDLVQRLLGMTAPQFCQVAMLPQGDFAAFLRANAEDRRRVLEKLFATEIYAAVEKWLAEHRAETGRAASLLEASVLATGDRVAEITGTARPDCDLLAWTTELAGHLDDVGAATDGLIPVVRKELDAAQRALADARLLAGDQARHTQAVSRQAVLALRAEARAGLEVRLEQAERAARIAPLGRVVSARQKTMAQATADATAARSRVVALKPPSPCDCLPPDQEQLTLGGPISTECSCGRSGLIPPDVSADVLSKVERAWRDEIARLEQLTGQVTRHRDVLRELGIRREDHERWHCEEDRLGRLLAELPGLVEEGRAALQDTQIQAAGVEAADKAVKDAAQAVEAGRRREIVVANLAQAEAEQLKAVDQAQGARERFQNLRQARLDGMAAALAADLVAGEACGVCGSTEHPAPAEGLGLAPSEADENRASHAYEQANRHREKAVARVEGLRAELDGLLALTDATVETLSAALEAAQQDLAARRAAAARSDQLTQQLAAAEVELTKAREGHNEAVKQLTELTATLAALTSEETRLRAELDQARGSDPSLPARISRLETESVQLSRAVEAINRAEAAREELATAEAELVEACAAEGFPSVEQAARAVLPDHERDRLLRELRAHDDEAAAIRDLLADPALQAAASRPVPDLVGLERAADDAQSRHTQVVSAHDRARHRSARLEELRAELQSGLRAWRPAAEAHETATRLANLATGQGVNRLSMRLSAYILAARLEQVVDAANERLTTMSAGRYLLKHTVDKSAGDTKRASGGLGLRVIDGWTGQERDPATLSGGESFITSLSLALGLADVVTAEAGGTEIATLFVDEGFGTLDEDTLDEVMDVLDSLRDGGRAVGVVSHVAELRSRIPTQLRLHKSRTGSSISVAV